jgi:hypothetical protein
VIDGSESDKGGWRIGRLEPYCIYWGRAAKGRYSDTADNEVRGWAKK